ncbi:MAG: hypothetical protein HY234_15370 [Acidobacteria bacterium]|nr:hypothetical protein [Acidobacteriota bacterium]
MHLLLNHLPVFGAAFGLLLLLAALLRKSGELTKISLAVFLLTALIAIPAYLSGEPSEDYVKDLPGVSKDMIEEHEESAVFSMAGVEILGILALAALWLSRHSSEVPRWAVLTTLILALATTGLMARTANLGGQIRHSEIRGTSGTSPTEMGTTKPEKPSKDDKE